MRVSTVKLNKILNRAKKVQVKSIHHIHIIDSKGYCTACCGECKYYNLPNEGIPEDMVFIIDDLEDFEKPNFEHVNNQILEAIVNGNYIMGEGVHAKKRSD